MARLIALVAALLLVSSSCSSSPEQVAMICVDPVTQVRYDDSLCQRHTAGWSFWYVPHGVVIPAYGWPVYGGSVTPPKRYVTVSAPSAGGVIEKQSRFRRSSAAPVVKPTTAAAQPRDRWTQPPPRNQQKQQQPKWTQPPAGNRQPAPPRVQPPPAQRPAPPPARR